MSFLLERGLAAACERPIAGFCKHFKAALRMLIKQRQAIGSNVIMQCLIADIKLDCI